MSLSTPFINRPVGTTADRRSRPGRRHRLHATAGVAAAAGGLPDDRVSAGLPGASPETMASAVATPLERQFGRIAGVTEMTSSSRWARRRSRCSSISTATSTPPRATCRRRSTRRAANSRRTCRATRRYRKVNPADAPILILALTSDTLRPRDDVRRGATRSWRRSCRRWKASAR